MKTGANGFKVIKEFEKCRLWAFKPILTDPWTIGWGHTKGVFAGDTCTQEQADAWLLEDIKECEDGVNNHCKVTLTQNEFDALISFSYNVGVYALANSTLLRLLNSEDRLGASAQFARWNKSKGIPLEGLSRRRAVEARLFLTPDSEKFDV
jgi:lysozyme